MYRLGHGANMQAMARLEDPGGGQSQEGVTRVKGRVWPPVLLRYYQCRAGEKADMTARREWRVQEYVQSVVPHVATRANGHIAVERMRLMVAS